MSRPLALLTLFATFGCRATDDDSALQAQIDALTEENAQLRADVDALRVDVDAQSVALDANGKADAALADDVTAITGGVDVTDLADDVDTLLTDVDDHEGRIAAIEDAPYASEIWVSAQGYATTSALG